MKSRILLSLCGIGSCALYLNLNKLSSGFLPGIDCSLYPVNKFLIIGAALGVIYLLSVYITGYGHHHKSITIIIILFSILFRILTITGTPILENDFNRYIWDGAVFSAGINPFSHAPDSDIDEFRELKKNPLIEKYHRNICYPDVPTIYPPVAQYFFYSAHKITPSAGKELLTIKLLIVMFDIATLLLIIKILAYLKLPSSFCVIYGWCPLVVKEFANSGHMDTPGIFFLLLALYLLLERKKIPSAIALAASFCIKFYPLIVLPYFLKRIKQHQPGKMTIFIAVFLLSAFIFYAPFYEPGTKIFTGLLTFANEWQINDSLFALFSCLSKKLIPEDMIYCLSFGIKGFNSYGRYSLLAVKIFSGMVLFSIVMYLLLRRYRNEGDLVRDSFLAMAFLFLLGPVGNPWYYCWLIPFLCFLRYRSFIILSCLMLLYYPVVYLETCSQNNGLCLPLSGICLSKINFILAEYIPFYLILVYEAVKCIRIKKNRLSQS